MVGQSLAAVLEGLDGQVIQVEADVHPGYPQFSIVGLPDSAVTESRLRIRSAIRNAGYTFPTGRITVNLSPASVRKRGAGLDLAIAVAILRASGRLPPMQQPHGFAAELSLSGDLVPISGIVALSLAFHRQGIQEIFVSDRQPRAPRLPYMFVWYKASSLSDVCRAITGQIQLSTAVPMASNSYANETRLDFAQVEGLASTKRAVLIAAAGRHHTLFVGPPGCGKTMIAERLPTILPPLTTDEVLEVYAIHERFQTFAHASTTPPLRMPHHSLTRAGLIGSGLPPAPGEATYAHKGILAFDELLEFDRNTLEALREPLVNQCIRIARAGKSFVLPAEFMLVATTNPCPCGQRGFADCSCTDATVRRYWSRFSGPLADRIDITTYVQPKESFGDGEAPKDSAYYQHHVIQAQAQLAYFRKALEDCQGDTSQLCTTDAWRLLQRASRALHLSRRGVDSVIRVAQTISSLESRSRIESADLEEALALRNTLLKN